MATLPILEIPHPVLRQRAKKVRTIDRKVMKLAYDMVDTMHEAGGVGLAANQVGELRRIIVLQMPVFTLIQRSSGPMAPGKSRKVA